MVGKWTVTETHEKSESSPGGIGNGTSVIALGRRPLPEDEDLRVQQSQVIL